MVEWLISHWFIGHILTNQPMTNEPMTNPPLPRQEYEARLRSKPSPAAPTR